MDLPQKKLLCRCKTTENQRNQTDPLPTAHLQIQSRKHEFLILVAIRF